MARHGGETRGVEEDGRLYAVVGYGRDEWGCLSIRRALLAPTTGWLAACGLVGPPLKRPLAGPQLGAALGSPELDHASARNTTTSASPCAPRRPRRALVLCLARCLAARPARCEPARARPPMEGRTKVRRRVLACARCRKRKLSVL